MSRFARQIRSFASSHAARVWLWMLLSWWATASLLWLFWPCRPRLTIDLEKSEIVGITADNQNLIAIEQTLPQSEVFVNFLSPGSIHVWNLRSGHHRTIPVPRSTWRNDSPASYFECRNESVTTMLSSSRWSMHGQWFEFRIMDGRQHRPTQSRNAILNLQDDSIHFSDNGESVLLSPTGRWFRRLNRSRVPAFVVCETATGKEQFAVQARPKEVGMHDRMPSPGCFSSNDVYFACTADEPHEKQTRVWNMETGKVILEIDECVLALEFSQSNRLMAGLIAAPGGDAKSQSLVEVVIWDIESGNVIHRRKLASPLTVTAHDDRPELKFTAGDTGLICYHMHPFQTFASYPQVAKQYSWVKSYFTWNFAANAAIVEIDEASLFDPNCNHWGVREQLPHFIASRDKTKGTVQLYHTVSRKPVWTLPDDAEPFLLTRHGDMLGYETGRFSPTAKLIYGAANRGVPVPRFILSLIRENSSYWSIVNPTSGRTVATIPRQRNKVTWLSPDEKTWVTATGDSISSNTINIWDFPPRKPLLEPMIWSLTAPAIVLLGWGLHRTRLCLRKRRGADSKSRCAA